MRNLPYSYNLETICIRVANTLEYAPASDPQQYTRNITLAIQLHIVSETILRNINNRARANWYSIYKRRGLRF